jgi:VWFA-related protein
MKTVVSLSRRALFASLPLVVVIAPFALSAGRGGAGARSGAGQPAAAPTSFPPLAVRFTFLVVDESGRSVAGVRREDVSVTDNGQPQTVEEFGRDEKPVSYGLLIDNSGSVRPLLDVLARAAGTLVASNRPNDEAFLMRFVDAKHAEILEDFTQSQQSLTDALSAMYVEGGQTAVIDAVYAAAKHVAERNADRSHRGALVLVTDGEDRGSSHSLEELSELLRREGVQVFVIGLTVLLDDTSGFIHKSSRERAAALLDSIAAASGGRAFFPKFGKKGADDLNEAAREIATDLQSPYFVAYTLAPEAADGKFHKVQVKVADAPGRVKRKVIAPPGYFAPGGESKKKDKS